jgi:predicted CXXCH cytochrome family protein
VALLAPVVNLLAQPNAAPAANGDGAASSLCARCHDTQATLAAATGGHAADLECIDCHTDRRPGRFGRRHMTIPTCGTHHGETRHPPAARATAPLQPRKNCLACHDVHGSPNLHLVRRLLPVRANRLVPVAFDNEAGASTGGFTDPSAPGTGLCEVCHRRTDVYRADGRGDPHFTDSCVLCHTHEAGFHPVPGNANCSLCHTAEAERFARPSAHSARLTCGGCHAELTPVAEPGHRRVPACAECHDRQTHAPTGHPAQPCTQCHDPHGSENTHLVREQIVTTQGGERPIRFDNVLGRVDGSFASASVPGTGICEVCHTATRFYRADGSGDAHFPYSCLPCHLHADGFKPSP